MNDTTSTVALGCMGMSGMYGKTSDDESVATIQEAIEKGITLLDTGDFYGTGHNEMLIGRAIQGRRDKVKLSVKFGVLRGPDGSWNGLDTRPAAIKNFLAYTLTRLGTDHVDIYRPGRLDPNVPIEDTVGTIAELVKKGYVRAIGLSEVGPETIRRAAKVHPIADLQIEYSIISRGPEVDIFPVLRELGIGVTAYGVLSRGLLTGSKPAGPADFRQYLPRFTGDNRAQNDKLVQALHDLAKEKGVRPATLCIAWARAKGKDIIPVVGAKTRAQLQDAVAAAKLQLSAQDVARLEETVPASAVAGTRYDAHQMANLDSERRA
ncbi:MAG TPA: aldo/keto reductase [Myxococcaceae bacterium]|nr:aldo/keto reductase [Myxococcaceae bacterium]